MNDEQLMRAASELKTDVSPGRDLWPKIEAAIVTPQKATARWTPMFAQAAAVVLLVGASSGVTYMAMNDQSMTAPGTIITNADNVFEQTSFANQYELGADFQSARQSLVNELNDELQKLSPEARLNVQSNLEVIHHTILEMNAALEENPDNTLLQERVLRSYRDELTVIRRVNNLARNVMLRNDI